ncbi:MAG TPA: hypothetical protein VMG13_07450, partial [Trebonia sp.]|nr:hypothetical protein [Trebonia sp.]
RTLAPAPGPRLELDGRDRDARAAQRMHPGHAAGAFSDDPLRCALDALGEDNVTCSVDYLFESMTEATQWLDASKLN